MSAVLGETGMLSVELAVSAHGVLISISSVGSQFLLFSDLVESLLEVAPVVPEPMSKAVSLSFEVEESGCCPMCHGIHFLHHSQ